MLLKRQLARIVMIGALAMAPTGTRLLSAGGYPPGCGWCGSPAPKAQATTAQPSPFFVLWTILSALF